MKPGIQSGSFFFVENHGFHSLRAELPTGRCKGIPNIMEVLTTGKIKDFRVWAYRQTAAKSGLTGPKLLEPAPTALPLHLCQTPRPRF